MQSRTLNTKRNILASYTLMVVQMVFTFVSKSIILNILGSDYLGLSSLFSSILQVLNIAELGFTSSIVYFMYKPLAENDDKKVCALLNELRSVYKHVGLFIFVVGICLIPFIPKLISGGVPNELNIYILYVLYLFNTCASYLLYAHKTALLTALQRLDLTKLANTVVICIQYVLQLIVLAYFKNYYLYLVIMILGTVTVNLFTAYVCLKKFPQYECAGKIDKNEKKDILKRVRGLLVCNVSNVTYTSMDSIIISSFIGLTSVAKYNNYIAIYSSVLSLIVVIRSSMQSSIGDSIVKESIEKNLGNLYTWQFLFSVIATWCSCCMLCLYQPVMKIWMGDGMLLPFTDVILIVCWFMAGVVQHAYYLYLTGAGLWDEMKLSYILSTIFNLLMNIVLGKLLGISGIILASLLSIIIFGTFWQCKIVFNEYFKTSCKKYILIQFFYFFVAFVVCFISYYACSYIVIEGIVGVLLKAFVCSFISILTMSMVYAKNDYCKKGIEIFKRVLKK